MTVLSLFIPCVKSVLWHIILMEGHKLQASENNVFRTSENAVSDVTRKWYHYDNRLSTTETKNE